MFTSLRVVDRVHSLPTELICFGGKSDNMDNGTFYVHCEIKLRFIRVFTGCKGVWLAFIV